MNSGHVEQALRQHINPFQQTLIPECCVRCDKGTKTGFSGYVYQDFIEYKADFMTISVAGYATEIEVKVSRSDWKCDLAKPKWDCLPPYISRFIYCVPEKLGMPDWIPSFAGVWHIIEQADGSMYVKTVRAPTRIGKDKVPDKVKEKWLSVFYHRYWHQRINNSHKLPLKAAA